MFRFVARFARIGILKSRPGDSREVLISVSESGFPEKNVAVAIFFCRDISCEGIFCQDISGQLIDHTENFITT